MAAPNTIIDIGTAGVQARLDRFVAELENIDAPPGYTYILLVDYLSDPITFQVEESRSRHEFSGIMSCRGDADGQSSLVHDICLKIRDIVGDHQSSPIPGIYLADGRIYVEGSLRAEFPELRVFNIAFTDSFIETAVPGYYVESARFAALRSLAQMRREIKRTGVRGSIVDALPILLGLTAST